MKPWLPYSRCHICKQVVVAYERKVLCGKCNGLGYPATPREAKKFRFWTTTADREKHGRKVR